MPAVVLREAPFEEVATKTLKKSKGFDREELPQIKGEDVDAFIAFLRRKDVEVTAGETPVADLKPTQDELNTEKIDNLTKGGLTDKLRSPIIISKDNYILDGHHRWAAVKKLDKDASIRTKRVGVPIKELIRLGHEFPKSFTKEIHEASGDALRRRLELRAAWKGRELPAPASGQVWASLGDDVVIEKVATHFLDAQGRPTHAIPGGAVHFRTRSRGSKKNLGAAMFLTMYVPAWRPGEIVLTEAQLTEVVQQVQNYLKTGGNQVFDHGTVGLFHVYSVLGYPDDPAIIRVRNLRRVHGFKWSYFLGKVHPASDYAKDRASDDGVFVEHPAIENWSKIRKTIQDASDSILALGLPRQRDTLILRDLSRETNRLTGGGVGGYAYRRSHAIEMDTDQAVKGYDELLVHEWAHKQFFNLPQHVTNYVRQWFDTNLSGNEAIAAVVTDEDRGNLIHGAWYSFNDEWRKQRGLDPADFIAHYKRVQREGVSDSQTDRLLDYLTRGAVMAYGRALKGFRNADKKGKGIRKGDKVRVMSARAVGPDMFMLVGPEMQTVDLSRKDLLAAFELDFGATKKEHSGLDIEQYGYAASAIATADPIKALTSDILLYGLLDAASRHIADALLKRGAGGGSILDVLASNAYDKFIAAWTARVKSEGLEFDPKKAFLDIFPTLVTWPAPEKDASVRAAKLSRPEGESMRKLARKLNITPSSYAAANVDELWAELVAYTSKNPSQVPKALKALLRDAMQGKTPGPGQRVRVDRTPAQFKKAASEAVVLCLPNMDEADVTKPQLDALERQLDALFKAAGIDVEFTRHFLDRVNDARNGRPITIEELRRIYQAVWTQHRATLDSADVDWRVVIRDLPTQINIPVVLDYDTRTGRVELVAKTVMRTARFMAREPQLVVRSEAMEEARKSHAARVRAYKKSGRMVSQTFSTAAALGASNTSDSMHAWYVEGLSAYDGGEPFESPYERDSLQDRGWRKGWLKGWQVEDFPADRKPVKESELQEGVDDPHVLKAVFLAGGGGSGKSFIGGKTFGDSGLRVVNTDPHFERLMRKAGLDTKKDVGSEAAQKLRPRAKELAVKQEKLLTSGRVGIIIDGTGDNPAKIAKKKAELEALGYDTSMVFVDVSLDVALARNKKRARVVPEDVLREAHALSQRAKATYQKMFGDKYANVVNDNALTPEEIARSLVPKLARVAKRLIDGPVQNPIGRKWVKSQVGADEKHRALGRERESGVTPEKTKSPDGPVRWRTTRTGKHIGFDRKGRAVMGNPHVLNAMGESRVRIAGAEFELVRENPNGTIRVRNTAGDEFDTEPGETFTRLADVAKPAQKGVPTGTREQYIRDELAALQLNRQEALRAVTVAIERAYSGPKLPVGISAVQALLTKARLTPAERALRAEYNVARKNLDIDTRVDVRHFGRVWDLMRKNEDAEDAHPLGFKFPSDVARPRVEAAIAALKFERVRFDLRKSTGKWLGEIHLGPPRRRGSYYLGDLWRLGAELRILRVQYGWAEAQSRVLSKTEVQRAGSTSLSATRDAQMWTLVEGLAESAWVTPSGYTIMRVPRSRRTRQNIAGLMGNRGVFAKGQPAGGSVFDNFEVAVVPNDLVAQLREAGATLARGAVEVSHYWGDSAATMAAARANLTRLGFRYAEESMPESLRGWLGAPTGAVVLRRDAFAV